MANEIDVLNYLEAGIKAEASRQKTIAGNVANMESPGYRRKDVRFEEILAKLIKSGKEVSPEDLEAQIYQPMTTTVDAKGNDVTLDHEVGEMVKNSLRHKTYMLLLKKKYLQMNEAIRVQ